MQIAGAHRPCHTPAAAAAPHVQDGDEGAVVFRHADDVNTGLAFDARVATDKTTGSTA